MDSSPSLAALIAQREQIEKEIRKHVLTSYSKFTMSQTVDANNPYSRLMALKKMGIVENYAVRAQNRLKNCNLKISRRDIARKSVLVVGVGGIGSVACEMLTRCGIGKLIIYDYDSVQLANMNRLFFTPTQVGMSKVAAAKQTLQLIHPEVVIEAYSLSITTTEGYEHLIDRIQHGGWVPKDQPPEQTKTRIDLVLSCVDNYSARMAINTACNNLDQIWFESGVSQSALSGHIQVLVPGETGCFGCASPLAVSQGTQHTIKREGVCAASLPTTMGIIAGLLSQSTLKFLLGFGQLSHCLSYNARTDFFNSYKIAINSQCKEPSCQSSQKRRKEGKGCQLHRIDRIVEKPKEVPKDKPKYMNEWGIEIVGASKDEEPLRKVEIKAEDSVESLLKQFESL